MRDFILKTLLKVKVKMLRMELRLISLPQAIEPICGYTTESVTHGQCDARPTVTFPATEHHHPLAGTNLYCLVNRATCV